MKPTHTALFVALVSVNDPERFLEYAGKAKETITAHGGEIQIRAQAESALTGELNHKSLAVIGFPDMNTLTKWYDSPEYQALIPLRDQASKMDITTYTL